MATCHEVLCGIKWNKIYHCYNLTVNAQMSIVKKEEKKNDNKRAYITCPSTLRQPQYMEWLLNSSVTLCTRRHTNINQQTSRAGSHSFICGWCCREVQYPYTRHTDLWVSWSKVPTRHVCSPFMVLNNVQKSRFLKVITWKREVRLIQDAIT